MTEKINDGAREPLERLVEKVAASHVFGGSASLRNLLRYLARSTFDNPDNPPKELEIATNVLHRPNDFDPQTDAAVRVLAVRLRSKLAEYYVSDGRNDPVAITLPRGSYHLEFHAARATASTPDVEVEKLRRAKPKWVWGADGLVGMLVIFAAFWAGTRFGSPPAGQSLTPEMRAVWGPFIQNGKSTALIMGVPMMNRIGQTVIRSFDVNSAADAAASVELAKIERALGAMRTPYSQYTGVGEAAGLVLLSRLLAAGPSEPLIGRSSVLNWDDVRANNVVFIGTPKAIPQMTSLPIDPEFECETTRSARILNRRPRPNELPAYSIMPADNASGFATSGYGLITRVSGLPGYGEILVLAGGTTECVWAAAEYVTKPNHVAEMLERIRRPDGKLPAAYQVVVRAKFEGQVPVEVSYVTHHELPVRRTKPNSVPSSPGGKVHANDNTR
jgi:hypothetical protein